MSTIPVTGGAACIGSHVVPQPTARGERVVVIACGRSLTVTEEPQPVAIHPC